MANGTRAEREARKNSIVKLFDSLCGKQSRWAVWSDLVYFMAAAISNAVDKEHADQREKEYMALAKKYSGKEMGTVAQIFAEIVQSMDDDPDQDLLGELYMSLELSNKHNGQFFTPYSLCRATAGLTDWDTLRQKAKDDGWISVNDPACGAGALLLAFANECKQQGINYQKSVLFVAQDIDGLVGRMCYIQLSLLGCPGYVVIADTIANPALSIDKKGLIPVDEGNVWYTPFYATDVWQWRRAAAQIDALCGNEKCNEKE